MKAHFLSRATFVAALALGVLGSAHAAEYKQIDAAASRIVFSYKQMGVAMDGGFSQLKVEQFSFDPANVQAAHIVIQVPLVSIDVGSTEANAEVEKSDWLNTPAHPEAKFESTRVEALGDNRYQVTGKLAIKGKVHEISAPFRFVQKGDMGVFDGAFTLDRGDFGIGEGMWSDVSIVANEINIKFHVVATH